MTAQRKPKTAKVLPFKPTKPVRRKIAIRTPTGKLNKNYVEVIHLRDPREELLKKIGPVPPEICVMTNILVAIYQPPMVSKTAGGIVLPFAMAEEDVDEYVWQGKVGLVVAMGPQAYVDDARHEFHGLKINVGDWVWFKPSDGQGCEVNEVPCRKFDAERYITGRLPNPDCVW